METNPLPVGPRRRTPPHDHNLDKTTGPRDQRTITGKRYEITYPARQWATSRGLRPTPLDDRWRAEKAHFGQVYGFERPLYFAKSEEPVLTFGKPAWFDQVGREVRQAHERAAVFDQSTFGKIRVTGRDAEAFLGRVCTNDMSRAPGRAVYTLVLNERGGIESDLVALRLDEEDYRLFVGPAAVKRDMAWLTRHLVAGEEVTLDDETEAHAVLALTGPEAALVAEALGAGALNELGYFQHREARIAGVEVRGVRLCGNSRASRRSNASSPSCSMTRKPRRSAASRSTPVTGLWERLHRPRSATGSESPWHWRRLTPNVLPKPGTSASTSTSPGPVLAAP